MKLILGSDLHGSYSNTKLLIEAMHREHGDILFLCGDLYYHGPRNPLPDDYRPMEVAKLLNKHKDIIRCIKGNCDSEVDESISEFSMQPNIDFAFGSSKVFLTHGHKYDINNPPPFFFDIMIYGHFHDGFIEKRGDKIYASPGSVSLPKNNSKKSYLLLEENSLTLKTLEGELLSMITID